MSGLQLFPTKIDELSQKQKENERELVFELVETPDNAQNDKAPEHAELVSDKNSIARDRLKQKDNTNGNPYSEGDFDVKNLPTVNVEPSPPVDAEINKQMKQKNKSRQEDVSDPEFTYEKFSRHQLLKKEQAVPTDRKNDINRPLYENRQFNAEDLGGFSFNTYNWDFAPYMLAMKRKVERNIFPPPAFTYMGLISGETIVRFKVMPNGEVKDLKVLRFSGHPSLKQTSVQAILNSSRFKPLPSDFPENFLEVTASFSYYTSKR